MKPKDEKEQTLTFMRKKHAELAATVFMFDDEGYGIPLTPAVDDEEDEPDMFDVLPENGDLLDSYESNTGNPMSGDSRTELYEYKKRFWIFNSVHGTCESFDTFEEACDYGGFKYRGGESDE